MSDKQLLHLLIGGELKKLDGPPEFKDLAKVDLSGADLRKVDLRGTILSGAVLTDADLAGANLFKAVLDRAELSGANLIGAQFLNCAQLVAARNWQSSFRDPDLACRAPIPAITTRS